jgi:thiamine biosynthesis lipoprotein
MRLIFFLLLLASGCKPSPRLYKQELTMMHMPLTLQLQGPLSARQEADIERAILDVFSHIHQVYNSFNPLSEISIINQSPAHTPIFISDELSLFLHRIQPIIENSHGLFDPTVASAVTLWKGAWQNKLIPSETERSAVQQSVGWAHVQLMPRFMIKDHPLTTLDLCAVAKGWAVDLLVDRLEHLGHESIYVNWGGEIVTRGSHPSGRPWQIAIVRGPTLALHNKAIATSGTYEQIWEIDGTFYTHLIHPKTSQAVEVTADSLVSATVIADSCLLADSLATALLLFKTKDEALAWIEAYYPEVKVYLMSYSEFKSPA